MTPTIDSNVLLTHPSGMSVELLNSMGDDLAIVNAARVSYGKESQYEYWTFDSASKHFLKRYSHDTSNDVCTFADGGWYKCLSSRDAGVLNYLLKQRHGTPFEMVQFKFRVTAPIGVIWEWVRHRISSFNIMSTRYVDWDRCFYTPALEDWRIQIGRNGDYQFAELEDSEVQYEYEAAMQAAFDSYERLRSRGLAREVARNVLPMGAMTQMVWSVNLRSLLNFLSLRTAPDALREIQICARMVEQLAETVVPETFGIWRRNEKVAP